MSTVAIRVTKEEHTLFMALAERERMPFSVYVRRLLYTEAERAGLVGSAPPADTNNQQAPTRPPLREDTINNEVLLKAMELGDSLTTIAQSNNLTVSEVQARLAKAKKARADGTLHREQALQSFMDSNPRPSPEHIIETTTSEGVTTHRWKLRTSAQAEQFRTDESMTMADADKNAEIARQRLLDLGFSV